MPQLNSQPSGNAVVSGLDSWKRWIIIVVCLGLATIRLIFPSVVVDANTIWLIGIAATVLILPELLRLLPNFKKLKVGALELEMAEEQVAEQVSEFAEATQEAVEVVAEEPPPDEPETLNEGIQEILDETKTDPRAALLRLSAKLETVVRRRLQEAKIDLPSRYVALPRAVQTGIDAGLFPAVVLPAVQRFWDLRSYLAHDEALDVPTSTVISLVSSGNELLNILSSENMLSSEKPTKPFTPQKAYRIPILKALDQLGGSAPVENVLQRVYEIMGSQLTEADKEILKSKPEKPRWRIMARWARFHMIKEGLLRKDSPYGYWEITDLGRQYLVRNADSPPTPGQ
ncbi:MAG: winged helix-turn-helix domain-containing protein [Chloroflexota bacterium]|nr:winged helix-turn-helix domain-containing protein [Chloroflexota bacterium]MDQ5864274.1 winged helix-turn-helix domain-containing protein [Chloroflexota bacterium]